VSVQFISGGQYTCTRARPLAQAGNSDGLFPLSLHIPLSLSLYLSFAFRPYSGISGEATNDICRNVDARDLRPQLIHDEPELLDGVLAAHQVQYSVGSRLDREVEVRVHIGVVRSQDPVGQ
jgi:hypothetical protein